MKNTREDHAHRQRGLTLVEVLVVLAVVVLLIGFLLPALSNHVGGPSLSIRCMQNLRTVGIGSLLYAHDHDGARPWRASRDFSEIRAARASEYFRMLASYVGENPGASSRVHCPTDKQREPAYGWAKLADQNISYFINLDAATNSSSAILSGDRNLQIDGQAVQGGIHTWHGGKEIGWGAGLHSTKEGIPRGNLVFSDGHAEQSEENLQQSFQRQGSVTNHLLFP